MGALSRPPDMPPLSTVGLRLAWDTPLLTIAMGAEGAVDSDEASGVAFWGASWEDGWAIAWRTVTPHPLQTRPLTPCRARQAGVEGSTPRLARISREMSPRTPEVAAILARSGRSATSREGEGVSNWTWDPILGAKERRCVRGSRVAYGSGMLGAYRPVPPGLSTRARMAVSVHGLPAGECYGEAQGDPWESGSDLLLL